MAFTTTAGAGGTSLIGTSGVDTATISTLTSSVFIGAQGDDDIVNIAATNGSASAYQVFMGEGNDIFTSAVLVASSVIQGNDGIDTFTIDGGLATTTLSGLDGTDFINLASNTSASLVNGNNGTDEILATASILGSTVAGGQGNDFILIDLDAEGSIAGSKINGNDGNDTLRIIELDADQDMTNSTIFGGQGDDTISGTFGLTEGNLILSGDLGNDLVLGGDGRDTLFGGDGADQIAGGESADTMTGGAGIDTFTPLIGSNAPVDLTDVNFNGVFVAGTVIGNGTNTFDIITDFTAGAGGDRVALGTANSFDNFVVNQGGFFSGDQLAISGTFSSSSGNFTVATSNTAGADTLILTIGSVGQGSSPAPLTASVAAILRGVNASQIVGSNIVA